MKILNLKAENIKRLVAVDITPKGNVVKITGKNGHGKTSVLDAIWWCLGGSKNIQKTPIHNGKDEAYVQLDLGEYIATRKFKYDKNGETTSSLKVESKDGSSIKSPQSLLDKIVGDLTFDPVEFERMDDKKQVETLRQFMPDVDFNAIDDANKADYEERTAINRQQKEKASAAALIPVEISTQDRVDTAELMKKIEEGAEHNADIEKRKANRENMNRRIVELEKEANELKKTLLDAGDLADPIDISELRHHFENAQETNALIDRFNNRKELMNEANDFKKKSEALTKSIEDRNKSKMDAISKAQLPVDGLSFGDGCIMYNELPFAQASDAERLRVSLAMAMAMNPELRVIRVRDGSLLDEDSMKVVEKMANEKDFDVWIEIVDGSGKVGFVIEEGQIKQEVEEY